MKLYYLKQYSREGKILMVVISLVYNLSVLVSVCVLSYFIDKKWKRGTNSGDFFQGLLFGLAVIIGMMQPFVFEEGIIFDGRSVVLGLAALFFGPITAIVSMAISMVYRLYISGEGATMGILVILLSTAIGTFFNQYRKKNDIKLRWFHLYTLGVVIVVAQLICMLALPSGVRMEIFKRIGIVILVVYPFATVLIGSILKDQEDNTQLINDLASSEEKYRSIFESMIDVFFRLDLDGTILLVSPSIKKIGGYEPEELIGKSVFDYYSNESGKKKSFDQILKDSWLNDIEVALIAADGSKKLLRTNAHLIKDSNGFPIAIEGILHDITDVKKTEVDLHKLSLAIQQIPISVVITDKKGVIEYVNNKAVDLTGYEIHEILGQKPSIFGSVETPASVHKELWETILAGKEWAGEFRNRKKNGELYWEAVSILPVFNKKDISHFIAVKEDITERKAMIGELITAKEHAEESDRLKSAFLANLSHEIRTPMNGILGFSDLLLNPDLTGETREEYIKLINQSGQRMLNIINDIVDISMIESKQVKVEIASFDLNELLDSILENFLLAAEKKSLKIRIINTHAASKCTFSTDHNKLTRILQCIINNAIKFTDTGEIQFGYSVTNGNLQFFVKDTGRGIPPHQKSFIFERFRQGSNSLTRNYEGAGLGLSIAKEFTEMLGGKIWCESRLGIGSIFYFEIPENKQSAMPSLN